MTGNGRFKRHGIGKDLREPLGVRVWQQLNRSGLWDIQQVCNREVSAITGDILSSIPDDELAQFRNLGAVGLARIRQHFPFREALNSVVMDAAERDWTTELE